MVIVNNVGQQGQNMKKTAGTLPERLPGNERN